MMTTKDCSSPEGRSPQAAALTPHSRTGRVVFVASLLTFASALSSLGVVGCEAADSAQVTAPYSVALGVSETPTYADANLTLYESQVPVPFPIRKPTGAELGAMKGNVAPYPHSPYLLDSDETIEVNYTITNLDNQSHAVWLLLDPWNEFVRYKPGVTVVSDDETEPNLSGIEDPIILNPLQRLQGNLQASDMSTLALKLDTAMKIMATTFTMDSVYGAATLLNHDFNIQNTPGPNDVLLATYTPTVVAGLTGFDLGLQSYEPMNVAIEVTVTVLDDSGTGKVLPPGTTTGLIGAPPAFLKIPGSM
jgi:hypothetical protein